MEGESVVLLISDIIEKTKSTRENVEEAIIASGFPVDDSKNYSSDDVYLVGLYVRYSTMLTEANEASYAFKYHDGEEGIDKTLVSDNMRRTAQMWYDRWETELENRKEKEERSKHAIFHVRKRV